MVVMQQRQARSALTLICVVSGVPGGSFAVIGSEEVPASTTHGPISANLPPSQLCVQEVRLKRLKLLVEREGLEPSTPAL